MYSSINRPFLTKNSYSSEDPLYSFYMKYSVIENRWGKILYSKRFIKQEIQVSVFPGAISWTNMNELRFIQKYKETIRSKSYWDKRTNAPLTPNSMLCGWLKRENSTRFYNIHHGGRGDADVL
jgi:hypothetical protein